MKKMKSSLTKLTINNAVFYSYHGVKDEERMLGGKYEIDADLYYDAKQAVLSDNVNDALNYQEAIFIISEVIGGEPYSLIETLCYEILGALMSKFGQLQKANVRLRKIHAPMGYLLDYVEVEQSLARGE